MLRTYQRVDKDAGQPARNDVEEGREEGAEEEDRRSYLSKGKA